MIETGDILASSLPDARPAHVGGADPGHRARQDEDAVTAATISLGRGAHQHDEIVLLRIPALVSPARFQANKEIREQFLIHSALKAFNGRINQTALHNIEDPPAQKLEKLQIAPATLQPGDDRRLDGVIGTERGVERKFERARSSIASLPFFKSCTSAERASLRCFGFGFSCFCSATRWREAPHSLRSSESPVHGFRLRGASNQDPATAAAYGAARFDLPS